MSSATPSFPTLQSELHIGGAMSALRLPAWAVCLGQARWRWWAATGGPQPDTVHKGYRVAAVRPAAYTLRRLPSA